MSLPFALPPIIAGGAIPIWIGDQFQIGSECIKVLPYSTNDQGWNDDLTHFHEESAGEQHFIDKASRNHAIQQLQDHLQQPKPTILEIGCSSGFMLQRIRSTFPHAIIIGSDVLSVPLQILSHTLPTTPLLRFDITHCPLPDNSIDAIVMLNVLEHVENETAALKQIQRILKPGGIAIIEVPAGPHLYDAYDKHMMHYRRYTLSDLCALSTTHGLNVVKKSHLGFFLYPGFWLVKKRNKYLSQQAPAQQLEQIEKEIKKTRGNKLINLLMKIELFIGKYVSYPTGIRCLVTCKKSSQ